MILKWSLSNYWNGVIVKLTFHGDQAKLPIVSEMLRQFPETNMSIIEGNIHQTQEGSIGSLYIQLTVDNDNQDQIKGALDYLKTMRVETEVINREQ